jgi:ribosome-binding protein aMBF1 (putative translation factor)
MQLCRNVQDGFHHLRDCNTDKGMAAMKTNAIETHIGTRMRELREARMVQLTDLAHQINVKPTDLADFEAARVRVPAAVIYWYCRLLDVEVKQIFEGLPIPV